MGNAMRKERASTHRLNRNNTCQQEATHPMKTKISVQEIYLKLWEEFRIPARERVRAIAELQKCRETWERMENELLTRCEEGDSDIRATGSTEKALMCIFLLKHPEHKARFQLEGIGL